MRNRDRRGATLRCWRRGVGLRGVCGRELPRLTSGAHVKNMSPQRQLGEWRGQNRPVGTAVSKPGARVSEHRERTRSPGKVSKFITVSPNGTGVRIYRRPLGTNDLMTNRNPGQRDG